MKYTNRFLANALAIVAFLSLGYAVAQPVNNPYRSRYAPVGQHWTDSLKWSTIYDVTTQSGVVSNGVVDSTAFHNLITTVSNAGGGVIYFPAGVYSLGFSVELKTGVVLRGADPVGIVNGKQDGYAPPSRLEFPKFIFDPTANGGQGNPRSTAFKGISAHENAYNIGLVNLGINRAHIAMHPHLYTNVGTPSSTYWPVDINHNVLIYGIRNNNAAIPEPSIPRATSPTQNPWQLWPWRFGANIDIYVSRNGIVANCRLNDSITDNFNQPGYIYGNATSCPSASMPSDGSGTAFQFTEHPGIVVNRGKINKQSIGSGTGPHAPLGIMGFITFATPATEPQLFAPGNEILDNYIFNTVRVGIHGAGDGLLVKGNIRRDRSGDIQYLDPSGRNCQTNNSATYENRAMDVSGWNVTVTGNSLQVFQDKIRTASGYLSVDGETILVQECCGGTEVKGYTWTHNTIEPGSSGYFGLWKMRDIYNVRIDSNDLNCKPILILANTGSSTAGTPYRILNTTIIGNKGVNAITFEGSLGQGNNIIANNEACATATDPTIKGYACGTPITNNDPLFTIDPCDAAIPTLNISVGITAPTATSVNVLPGSTTAIVATASNADSIRYFLGTTALTPWLAPTTANLSYNFVAPQQAGNFTFAVQAKTTGGVLAWSNPILFKIAPLSVSAKSAVKSLEIYPNPASDVLNFKGEWVGKNGGTIQFFDLSGRVVLSKVVSSGNIDESFDVSRLNNGLYIIRILDTDGNQTTSKIIID